MPSYDFSQLDALLDSPEAQIDGGLSLVLRFGGQQVYARSVRRHLARWRQYIASATKWTTAALLLRLCSHEGFGLSLDDPPAKWLPGWGGDDPRKARITLRMLLSHTHGLPAVPQALNERSLNLHEAAMAIGQEELQFEPGAGFLYSEGGMQVAGALAQTASGLSYLELFERELSEPLGIPEMNFIGPSGQPPQQPHLGGGLHCCAEDYCVFLEALHDNWRLAQGEELPVGSPARSFAISPPLMREMFAERTAGIEPPFASTPYVLVPGMHRTGYGLGCWREELDAGGALLVASSQGLPGTSPWIDFDTGISGCLWALSHFAKVYPLYREIRLAARRIIKGG
ncbi:beta-lactamase family protein [bacterium]|nr:beta-lactamase family protein [bacterium]